MINLFHAFLVLAASASLSFGITTKTVPVGEEVKVPLYVSSAGIETIGTDIVISFDPKILYATKVVPGDLYPSYPPNTIDIDNTHGKIWFSGTVGTHVPRVVEGTVGSVFFRTKKVGITSISFTFERQGTADSNIIPLLGPVDLLNEQPKDLELVIKEANFLERILFSLQRITSFDYLRF